MNVTKLSQISYRLKKITGGTVYYCHTTVYYLGMCGMDFSILGRFGSAFYKLGQFGSEFGSESLKNSVVSSVFT
jgi:hypothetical protein